MLLFLKNSQLGMAAVLAVISVPLAIYVHHIPPAILFGCILVLCILNVWINCSAPFLFLSFMSAAMVVWPTVAISTLMSVVTERYIYLLDVSVLAVLIAFIGGRCLCPKKLDPGCLFLALASGFLIAAIIFRDQLLYEPNLLIIFLLLASFVAANIGASNHNLPRLSRPVSLAFSVFLIATFFISNYGVRKPLPKLALIECFGKWAETKTPFTLEDITLQSGYSYSLMKEVLQSRYPLVSVEERSALKKTLDEVDAAIIVTPTIPLHPTDALALDNFIERGGRLVLIADHTDLYGHGRVINAYLNRFNTGVNYDAVFEPSNYHARLRLPNTTIQSVRPKSACSLQLGFNGFVFAWADRWVSEGADYNRPNFFGEMAWTSDDSFGRWPVGVIANRGKGAFVLWGDSTIFANFCIFQPEHLSVLGMLIEEGAFHARWNTYHKWLLIIAIFSLFFGRLTRSRVILFLAFGLTVVSGGYHLWDFDLQGFFPRDKRIDVYCERVLLDEPPPGSLPRENGFSSAYSHIARCGLWPLYRGERPGRSVESRSIWIAPWREISKADCSTLGSVCRIVVNDKIPHGNGIGFEPVYVGDGIAHPLNGYLGIGSQMRQQFVTKGNKHTMVRCATSIFAANGVMTDRYFGDWWVTTEISPYRTFMLKEFFNWLIAGKAISRFVYPDAGVGSGDKEWLIRVDSGRHGTEKMLVRPFEEDKRFVYLGAGIWSLYEETSEGSFLLGGPETSDDWLITRNTRWGAQRLK